MNFYLLPIGSILLSLLLMGCGGDGSEIDPVPTNDAEPGITGGFIGAAGGTGAVPGIPEVTDTQDAYSEPVPREGDDVVSPQEDGTTDEETSGDAGSDEEQEDTTIQADAPEEVDPWEGMEGMEGALLLTDVDSTFDDADIASIGAFFGILPEATAPLATYENCQVIEGEDDTALPTSASLNGGSILFEGLSLPLSAVHGEGEAGVYTSSLAEGTPDIFLPSGDITISSQGSTEFPPFSLVMATPTPLTVQSPDLGGGTKIDRDQPLTLSWTPSPESDFMNVFMAGVSTSGDFLDGPRVTCTVEGDPGFITVPSAALKMLPVESSLFGGGYLLVGITRGTTSTATDCPLQVNGTALRSTGGIVEAD